MFGIRAKALFVYLAVSFVLNETGKTESAKVEFSCEFEDDNYKMKNTTNPIWSTKNTPDDIVIENNAQWDSFSHDINQIFVETLSKNPLNNVDQFVRFIQAYKNQTDDKKSLESFFKDYHVPFQTLEDPVSFLIQIYRRLKEKHAHVNGQLYIVSAYVNPSEDLVDKVRRGVELSAERELIKDRFQRHVAGIIKFKFDGNKERGIIVLDPGYMNGYERVYPYSAVIMEKRKSQFNGEIIVGYGKGDIDESHLEKRFGLVSISPLHCPECQATVLYLHSKPFCSFMDSTTKGNLLADHHGIMTFDSFANPRGYLTFDVVPRSFNSFTIGPIEPVTRKYVGMGMIFTAIKPANMNPRRSEFENATNYFTLGEGRGDLLSKLQTIQSVVFEDRVLVTEIYELTRKLNQKV